MIEDSAAPQPVSVWHARAWMLWTLMGVLLSCLVAFILAPVRALVAE